MTAEEFIALKQQQFQEALKDRRPLLFKDIGRKGHHRWIRRAWTFDKQRSNAEKVFVMERLHYIGSDGKIAHPVHRSVIQYRISYWIVGRIGKARGRWRFAQFCPMIPSSELKSLISKARNEGTIRDKDWPEN